MKNKELKNFIKNKADSIVINDRSNAILSSVDVKVNINSSINKKKNRLFIPILVSLVAVLIGVFVYIAIPKSTIDPQPSKAKEKLVYEVAALGNIMHSSNSISTMKMSRIGYDKANAVANEVHNYLLTGEMMLNKNNVKSIISENTNSNYDFEYKMAVSYQDNSSYKSEYTLYFTEYKKIESDFSIDEVSSYLNGVMLIGEKEYVVKGEKEIERDEIETELSIYSNENSYIKISQGIENNENEYEYEFVENGKDTKTLSLEVEENVFTKTMNISIEEAKQEKEYEFEYHKNYIECKFEDDNTEEEYKIKIEIYKEYYLYIFSDDIQIKINK